MSIKGTFLNTIGVLLLAIGSVTIGTPSAIAWDEDIFYGKTIIVARPFTLPERPGDLSAQTIVGSPRQYTLQKKDTLLDIARYLDLVSTPTWIRGYHPLEKLLSYRPFGFCLKVDMRGS